MRLPALTHGQKATEAARQFHEQLYRAYELRLVTGEGSGRALILTAPESRELKQKQISGTLKDFWQRRGFRLKTHQTPKGVECWLETRG